MCVDYGNNVIPLISNVSAYLFHTSTNSMVGDFNFQILSQGSHFYVTYINGGNMTNSNVVLHSSNSNTIEVSSSKTITSNTHYLYSGGGSNGIITKLN